MSALRIEFKSGNLRLPELGLWLDPHEPVLGTDKVFVSHAHSDHTAAHREVILSKPTSSLMQARVPGTRLEHILEFAEKRRFQDLSTEFDITLLPAGHIFGSAMSLIETAGGSLLYTGDFKLKRGLSAESCEPRKADTLVMETTYGRPQYIFPPSDAVIQGVVRFCREALDNDETPVLLGYSLGKSQEVLSGLGEAGLPLMLHGTVYRLTRIYERFGHSFPNYEKYDARTARRKVLLCPPNVANSALLRKLGKIRSAILTGWAVDPNCRFRYQCDAAFPLSDHADFPDLIELVKQVQPKKIYTLHGFAADFAQTLRDMGYDAAALSEDEQITLAIGGMGHKPQKNRHAAPSRALATASPQIPNASGGVGAKLTRDSSGEAAHLFVTFASTCSSIASERGKLEKVRQVAEYLMTLTSDAVALTATWFIGRPFPAVQNKVLQLGWAVLREAFCTVGKVDETSLHQIYLKHSDAGESAAEILQNHQNDPTISLEEMNRLFHNIHAARAHAAKTQLLIGILERCTPVEGKFLVKIITGDLRIGLKEGLLEEAVAIAFNESADDVRQANLLTGDIAETARLAAVHQLNAASMTPFRPIKLMLASPEPTSEAIQERVRAWREATEGKQAAAQNVPQAIQIAAWLEDKYDGIRCQLHKSGRRIELFSRDLKTITQTFPELVNSLQGAPGDFILDGEVVAMRGDQVLPFDELQKRLGRKEPDLFMRDEVPIQYVAFDLLWLNGASLLDRPLSERRRKLETIEHGGLRLAHMAQATSASEIEAAFAAARSRGNEGLMIKDPASVYSPGRRGLSWLKLKKALATLDCVVVGAEYGHGKRGKVLSDYTFAVRDELSGELKVIGKAYTGLTDAEIAFLTEHFLKHAVRQRGRFFAVEPDIVLEIAFDKIQESDRHESGLAMRFPRIVRIRTDKPVSEIDTIEAARKLVAGGAKS